MVMANDNDIFTIEFMTRLSHGDQEDADVAHCPNTSMARWLRRTRDDTFGRSIRLAATTL
jgi:hypothetical protein